MCTRTHRQYCVYHMHTSCNPHASLCQPPFSSTKKPTNLRTSTPRSLGPLLDSPRLSLGLPRSTLPRSDLQTLAISDGSATTFAARPRSRVPPPPPHWEARHCGEAPPPRPPLRRRRPSPRVHPNAVNDELKRPRTNNCCNVNWATAWSLIALPNNPATFVLVKCVRTKLNRCSGWRACTTME